MSDPAVALNNLCSATDALVSRLHLGGWVDGADSTGVMLSVRAALDDARRVLVLVSASESLAAGLCSCGKPAVTEEDGVPRCASSAVKA